MKHPVGWTVIFIAIVFFHQAAWGFSGSSARQVDFSDGFVLFFEVPGQWNGPRVEIAQAGSTGSSTSPDPAIEETPQKVFKTKHTSVHYSNDQDLDDFIWRLGGQKMEITNDPELASSRIDRLVNRVQMILDMWPENFQIDIQLHRGPLKNNKVAYYEYQTKTIHICVDYTSDGVIAHELAHANIDQYFPSSPPSKMQEILSQYVDSHLWSDY